MTCLRKKGCKGSGNVRLLITVIGIHLLGYCSSKILVTYDLILKVKAIYIQTTIKIYVAIFCLACEIMYRIIPPMVIAHIPKSIMKILSVL